MCVVFKSFIVSGVQKVSLTIQKHPVTGVKVDKSSLLNQLSFMFGLKVLIGQGTKTHTQGH